MTRPERTISADPSSGSINTQFLDTEVSHQQTIKATLLHFSAEIMSYLGVQLFRMVSYGPAGSQKYSSPQRARASAQAQDRSDSILQRWRAFLQQEQEKESLHDEAKTIISKDVFCKHPLNRATESYCLHVADAANVEITPNDKVSFFSFQIIYIKK